MRTVRFGIHGGGRSTGSAGAPRSGGSATADGPADGVLSRLSSLLFVALPGSLGCAVASFAASIARTKTSPTERESALRRSDLRPGILIRDCPRYPKISLQ